eukprot:m.377695 g.377695  ORF g.377695 m.377695 type:complete len:310 (+) comp20022_c1_seq10:104-1033(+)
MAAAGAAAEATIAGDDRVDVNPLHFGVVLRCRPPNRREAEVGLPSNVRLDTEANMVTHVAEDGKEREFQVDRVVGPEATQADAHEAIRPVVQQALMGYDGCVVVYGETGSGKNHTLIGDLENPELFGMVLRAACDVFGHIKTAADTCRYSIALSVVEMHRGAVQDLLRTERTHLRVRESPETGVFVQGLSHTIVHNTNDVRELIRVAHRNEVVETTRMSRRSANTCVFYDLTIERADLAREGEPLVTCSQLRFVRMPVSCEQTSPRYDTMTRFCGEPAEFCFLFCFGLVFFFSLNSTPNRQVMDSRVDF